MLCGAADFGNYSSLPYVGLDRSLQVAGWPILDDRMCGVTSQECAKPSMLLSSIYLSLGTSSANCLQMSAGIRSRLEDYGKLHHFSALNRKDINWDVERRPVIVEGDNPPATFPPQPKRRKLSSCDIKSIIKNITQNP